MKVTVVFKNVEVKEALKKLKRRKSMFIQCAVYHFLKTDTGKWLLENMAYQEKKEEETKNKATKNINQDKISIDDFLS